MAAFLVVAFFLVAVFFLGAAFFLVAVEAFFLVAVFFLGAAFFLGAYVTQGETRTYCEQTNVNMKQIYGCTINYLQPSSWVRSSS